MSQPASLSLLNPVSSEQFAVGVIANDRPAIIAQKIYEHEKSTSRFLEQLFQQFLSHAEDVISVGKPENVEVLKKVKEIALSMLKDVTAHNQSVLCWENEALKQLQVTQKRCDQAILDASIVAQISLQTQKTQAFQTLHSQASRELIQTQNELKETQNLFHLVSTQLNTERREYDLIVTSLKGERQKLSDLLFATQLFFKELCQQNGSSNFFEFQELKERQIASLQLKLIDRENEVGSVRQQLIVLEKLANSAILKLSEKEEKIRVKKVEDKKALEQLENSAALQLSVKEEKIRVKKVEIERLQRELQNKKRSLKYCGTGLVISSLILVPMAYFGTGLLTLIGPLVFFMGGVSLWIHSRL